MANIVGGVTSINNPRTNWAQTDKTKADFLKNKPSVANALKGTASGEAIAISDASPIEHEMDVKVRGKNLINMSAVTIPNGQSYSYENGIATISQGTYVYSPRARWDFVDVSMFEGKTLTVSLDVTEDQGTNTQGNILYIQGISDKEYALKTHGFTQTGKITLTYTFADKLDYDKIRIMLYAQHLKDASESLSFTNVQFEIGTTATDYVPYIEDISSVKVKKYGKNLIDIDNPSSFNSANYEVADDVVTITRRDSAYYPSIYFKVGKYADFVGKTITFSCTILSDGGTSDMKNIMYLSGSQGNSFSKFTIQTHVPTVGVVQKVTATIPENAEAEDLVARVFLQSMAEVGEVMTIAGFQLEVGTTATAYEPYIEPIEYPVSADGAVEGITPYKDTTTLVTDTAGAVIDCTYNRDVNKVITDLENKFNTLLATIGG